MPEWASAQDVRSRLLTDEEWTDEQLNVLVEDAEDVILRQLPELPRWVKADQIRVRTIQRVVSRMVQRVLRNPEGIRTISDTTGPYGGSTTFAGDNPGELYLSDDDRKELTPAGLGGGRRAFSVMPNYARG